MVPKAIKRSYTCCIYLDDNICDPKDSECIEMYNKQNVRFIVISFSVFTFFLFVILIASFIRGRINRKAQIPNFAQEMENMANRKSIIQQISLRRQLTNKKSRAHQLMVVPETEEVDFEEHSKRSSKSETLSKMRNSGENMMRNSGEYIARVQPPMFFS